MQFFNENNAHACITVIEKRSCVFLPSKRLWIDYQDFHIIQFGQTKYNVGDKIHWCNKPNRDTRSYSISTSDNFV